MTTHSIPGRVPLLLRVELLVLDDGRVEVFPRTSGTVAGFAAETELNNFLRSLSLRDAWAWRLSARVTFEDLAPLDVDWVLNRGKFVPARRAIAAALLASANLDDVSPIRARELVALVEHIRGWPLDAEEVPLRLRPQPAHLALTTMAWAAQLAPAPEGFCRCGYRIPRVRVYVCGQRRAVLALHGLNPRRPGPCRWVEHQWRTYDPILPQAFDSFPDPDRDVPMDTEEWRRIVWSRVPPNLGGPFAPPTRFLHEQVQVRLRPHAAVIALHP